MLKSDWLQRFPNKSADGALEFLNTFNFGVTTGAKGRTWWVATGEKILLETDEEETAKGFILGMAIGYLALPNDIVEQIRERFGA